VVTGFGGKETELKNHPCFFLDLPLCTRTFYPELFPHSKNVNKLSSLVGYWRGLNKIQHGKFLAGSLAHISGPMNGGYYSYYLIGGY
jgi:hypothetical protein